MLVWLSRRVVKDAWYVVGTWAALVVILLAVSLGGLGGTGLFGRLEASGSSAAGTQSAEGEQILHTLTGDSQSVSLLVTGVDLSSAETQRQVSSALAGAHADLRALVGEQNVLDPFVVPGMLSQPAAQALASSDLDGFLMVVTVNPNGDAVASADDKAYEEEVAALVRKVETRLRAVPDELRDISPGASGVVSDKMLMSQAVNDQVERDLVRGELISLPLALLVMVVVFGGFLIAGMPLLGALASIVGSLGVLYALSLITDLQSFVVNIASIIGLGLSIDYGLLLTSRYREELDRGLDDEIESTADGRLRRRRTGRRDPLIAQCMTTTLTTAGRTVLFSGLTVAVALMGLVLMGNSILWSIGVAGMAVVLIAVAAALTLVPALLVLLGRRLLRPSVPQRLVRLIARRRRARDVDAGFGAFAWIARQVHRMPWVVLVACIALLVVLASPLRGARMLTSTTELLPPDSDQRTYLTTLQEDYPESVEEDATLIVYGTGDRVTSYINDQVAYVDGVTQVKPTIAGKYTVAFLDLEGGASSQAAERTVAAIQALDAPADTWITGQAASQYDFRQTIIHGLPKVVGVLLLASFVLLFLMTGSVLVPFKALLVNVLSLAASLGVLVWVFQGGHLSGLLGFTPIGGVEGYVMVTAVGVGLGLAMDYEVFILARIKEYWDGGDDNNTAVERGLQRSGRIVTSAALIMVIVFLGFVAGDLLIIKEIGLALAVMVALDATVVRLLLVPATMSLLGRWNWWAPAFLRDARERFLA